MCHPARLQGNEWEERWGEKYWSAGVCAGKGQGHSLSRPFDSLQPTTPHRRAAARACAAPLPSTAAGGAGPLCCRL